MEESPAGGESRSLGIPAAIIVAGLIIAGAVIWSNQRSSPGQLTASPTGQTSPSGSAPTAGQGSQSAAAPSADDDPFLGPAEAKVTIIEFSDFQCPFCGRFFRDAEPRIIENYVKTGKARFVYRDLAFLGEESVRAAEAANCAREQNKFWEYHDKLFTSQSGENNGAFSDDNLKKFARDLQLGDQAFDACLDSGKYKSEVQKDTDDARLAGATGTPTVFINGRVLVGALPYENFAKVIEEELGN
ncbi:DsbA family protein [Candidatus Parcubacteria bacterium]|nr:DsbA family protein [Candidatus Parcubacteria bacterium]